MKFRYRAKTKEGELQVGFVEAATQEAAGAVLTNHNLFILSLAESGKVHWWDRIGAFLSRVRKRDLAVFTRQLATLLEARLPLNNALNVLYDQTSHPVLKQAVKQVSEDVSSGLSFSQAFERQGTIFPTFFISMIRSAELIGNLEETVSFLADYTEKEYELASKARSALVYPAIVIAMFFVVAIIMLTVVFPQIGPIFEQTGVTLPWYTKVFLDTGSLIGTWWPLLVIVVVFVAAFVINYLQTLEGRALWDDLKVRLPLIRNVYLPLLLTRLSNAMYALLKGGVPITQALEIVSETVDNALYRDLLSDVAQEVRQGIPLSTAVKKYPDYFPIFVSHMLVVGEATGQINKMFSRLAAFYGREADNKISNITDLIQPLLMVVVGVLVGFLFAAILIPLYRLVATIQ